MLKTRGPISLLWGAFEESRTQKREAASHGQKKMGSVGLEGNTLREEVKSSGGADTCQGYRLSRDLETENTVSDRSLRRGLKAGAQLRQWSVEQHSGSVHGALQTALDAAAPRTTNKLPWGMWGAFWGFPETRVSVNLRRGPLNLPWWGR